MKGINLGKKNPMWKGGRFYLTRDKVYMILVNPKSKFYEMANQFGYVPEHRYVMAKHLGRSLQSQEIVHHIDKNPHDNSVGNLRLTTRRDHVWLHRKRGIRECNRCGELFFPKRTPRFPTVYCSRECYFMYIKAA